MFKNLKHEFKKNNIKLAEIASFLNISVSVLKMKLDGKIDFKIAECLKIQDLIGRGNLCLEYLFKRA